MTDAGPEALEIAARIRAGEVSAADLLEGTLAQIEAADGPLNSFTAVLRDRARTTASRIDAAIARGLPVGPLAGVPYAVKELFDVAGSVTLSGSLINRSRPPAAEDAAAIKAMDRAGAVLVGTLNMDEYACGFTTENAHRGACRNPWDPTRIAGGSSGGSAAAVAAGFVPIALGSDTNGSVRVPASLCGVVGFKPTYDLVPTDGMEPYAASFDHVGFLTRNIDDAAATLSALIPDGTTLPECPSDLSLGVLDDHFAQSGEPEVFAAVMEVAAVLGCDRRVAMPGAAEARAAAMVMSAAEGAAAHRNDLRDRAAEFDPMTRDRFIAGALLPASAYVVAARFRRWFRREVLKLFESVDIVLAPTTPFSAPLVGQRDRIVAGRSVVPHLHLGVYTAPLSFIGLPVVSVPIHRDGVLPVGVQLIGPPGGDGAILEIARRLEGSGVFGFPERVPSWT